MEEETLAEEDGPSGRLTTGERLREARKERGVEIAQVAAETRIPQRHLVSIENGEFSKLPSRTYAIGFTRTYARTLDLDEHEILDQLRQELAEGSGGEDAAPARFEPGDPARIPSRRLAWLGSAAALLILVGGFAFYRTYFAPGIGPAPLQVDPEPTADTVANTASQEAAPAIDPNAEVVFTSEMDGTWVKFYDAAGETLFEAQMANGDSFTIPRDAEGPQVWTGRPYALAITVGGKPVPKLSEEDEIVRDVPVTAEALLGRSRPQPSPDAASASPAEEG